MKVSAAIANALWGASNFPAYLRFRRALADPQRTQEIRLRSYLKQNANTTFGKTYHFHKIRGYDDFARRVPLAEYESLVPWITRIRQGESNVLTHEPVTHLTPTSGSTGARKLIPFTAGLQSEFNAAIGPWTVDLNKQLPGIIAGPAYWSITPCLQNNDAEESLVPIGFDTDSAYLGGARKRLAETVMAVPSSVQGARSIETFRRETLLHLLRCRELRLISIWHPSFLTLLLDSLPEFWNRLLYDIEHGTDSASPFRRRSRELRLADPSKPETLWPSLQMVSCWGSAAAAFGLEDIRQRFPNIYLQQKGLIATEAFVTLPFEQQYPLAINSHFFEFLDENGQTHLAQELHVGNEYEIVVTNGGGLWRYRLGDRVRVNGFLQKTPTLEFLGRGQNTSDRFGEKLTEAFATEVLRELFRKTPPRFALLAPDQDNNKGWRYTLYIEGETQPGWPEALDHALRQNPHYAYCRDLGQLLPPALFRIERGAYGAFIRQQAVKGARVGDIKPTSLIYSTGWSNVFTGMYVDGLFNYVVSQSLGKGTGESAMANEMSDPDKKDPKHLAGIGASGRT